MAETFMNRDRVVELWTAIKTALAGKADLSDLENYATPEAVATAIASALTDYPKNADVQTAITTALADYMTATEVSDAITEAVVKAAGIKFEAVDALPESGKENVIYLVPNSGEKLAVEILHGDRNGETLSVVKKNSSLFGECYGLNISSGGEEQITLKFSNGYATSFSVTDTSTLQEVADSANSTIQNLGYTMYVDPKNGGVFVSTPINGNVKDEYMWIDGKWEVMGSTAVNFDGYWSKNELKAMTAEELKGLLV